ncbi:receptor-type tyrosine-protein phosphatase [Anaeramoeba ignava]|uniref:Receptor-type tyrosine-protein phosphatase n=1 Tax=Anaeramoeba ignava TaxID=1746090 RepID=A0A9Q0RGQ2_ANAIG|nr:receptor-type tyrosine-protein phosphatase [Anaeramoeba ignava]
MNKIEDLLKNYSNLNYKQSRDIYPSHQKSNKNNETTEATESENLPKNRYSDVLPNNKFRVHLKNSVNDYINASFIFDNENTDIDNPKYIACQCPLLRTQNDFWQMILEQNAFVIVSLTDAQRISHRNIRTKCEKFWPKKNSPLKLNNIIIEHAGIGRTGVFILVDLILKRLKNAIIQQKEKGIEIPKQILDIPETLIELRKYRYGLVQTVPQFQFAIHMIGKVGLEIFIKKLFQLKLQKSQDIYPSYQKSNKNNETTEAEKPENMLKNRHSDVLPNNKFRVHLKNSVNDYINASFIFDNENTDIDNPKYIACQCPLLRTQNDFWQMILEQNVFVIVSLTDAEHLSTDENNRHKCGKFWPKKNSLLKFNNIIIEKRSKDFHENCKNLVIRKLEIKYEKETRIISHIQYLGWPDFGVPETTEEFELLRNFVNENCEKVPIVVHCCAGVGRTGVFILVDLILKRLKNAIIQQKEKGIEIPKQILDIPETLIEIWKYKYVLQSIPQFQFAIHTIGKVGLEMLKKI